MLRDGVERLVNRPTAEECGRDVVHRREEAVLPACARPRPRANRRIADAGHDETVGALAGVDSAMSTGTSALARDQDYVGRSGHRTHAAVLRNVRRTLGDVLGPNARRDEHLDLCTDELIAR